MFAGVPFCHPRAWLPREGFLIPGFLARRTTQTRGNDITSSELTHRREILPFRSLFLFNHITLLKRATDNEGKTICDYRECSWKLLIHSPDWAVLGRGARVFRI